MFFLPGTVHVSAYTDFVGGTHSLSDHVKKVQEQIDLIFKSVDEQDRQSRLVSYLLELAHELGSTEDKLQSAVDERDRKESLLRLNPDTELPIYRVLFQDIEKLISAKKPFWIAQIRLDNAYQRIKSHRDRNKVLLFISTMRIQQVLGQCLYQSDRLDEFFVLKEEDIDSRETRRQLVKTLKHIELPHEGPAGDIAFGAYAGFLRVNSSDGAINPEGAKTSELLTELDIAFFYGLQHKRRIVEYNPDIGAAHNKQLRLEQDLRAAIPNGFEGFFMVYQPFVDSDGYIRGSEALIRWKHPEFGFIPPPEFIPIAERNGDIQIFGRWILYQSIIQLKLWRDMGFPDMYVSVNLSPVQFLQKDMVERITDILESTNVPGAALKLEITEGAIMADPADAILKLAALRKLGVKVSIDDFGTGYSSLNYLRKLPIDTLKVDKSFIDDICTNLQNREIVRAILSMARSLNIETLAEGVETADQRDLLLNEGIQLIQGYYYSKPVTAQVFTEYLHKGAILPQVNTES